MGLWLSLFTFFVMSYPFWPIGSSPFALQTASSLLLSLVCIKLLSFKRWSDETPCVNKFLLFLTLALVELALENGLVFVISAIDTRRLEYVPALQDNVEILLNAVASLQWFSSLRWMDTLSFLVILLALPFSSLWDQTRFSGFGLMSRVMATMFLSRSLRVICFSATILPSPRPGCSLRRFPLKVPNTWFGILLAGYKEIRGFGGCNDLIFSGHGAFWILAPLSYQSYAIEEAGRGWKSSISRTLSQLSVLIQWVGLIQASLRDVIDKQHYSVDMILAAVVVSACWSWTEWIHPPHSCRIQPRQSGLEADKIRPEIFLLVAMCVAVAGVIVIGGKA